MLKKAVVSFITITALLFNLLVLPTFASIDEEGFDARTVAKILDKTNVFELKAKASILMDAASGSILVENNIHDKLQLASVTKVMSMLLIMEAVDSGKITFDDKVQVSEHSYGMGGSQVWLEPGEEFTVSDLLKAVAIHSANDATVALAEKVAGSEETFVQMMNEKAKELGMNDTNYLDCTGLAEVDRDGHYSSAYDIAVVSRELITKHPKILEYTSTWQASFREGVAGKKPVSLDNTNKLVRFYEGTKGLKTGFTRKAGYCLSAVAQRKNLMLISVVLGEADTNTRFAESRKLLDYGFANYEATKVNNKGEVVQEVEVKKGLKTKVPAIYPDDINLLVKKGSTGNIKREFNINTDITAPVKAGQKLGEVIYMMGEKEVGRADLVAENDVEKASFTRLFLRMLLSWFGIGRK